MIQTVSLNSIWMSDFCVEQMKHCFHCLPVLVLRCQAADQHLNPKRYFHRAARSWGLIYNLDLIHSLFAGRRFGHSFVTRGVQRKLQVHEQFILCTVWDYSDSILMDCSSPGDCTPERVLGMYKPQTYANYSNYVSIVQHKYHFATRTETAPGRIARTCLAAAASQVSIPSQVTHEYPLIGMMLTEGSNLNK